MKINYSCEVCGEVYDREEDAKACELKHAAEEEQARREKDKQEERARAISDAYNAYVEKYKVTPKIVLTEANENIILEKMVNNFFSMFN